MYKDETILDLFNRVSHHFGCRDIKGLYIDSCLNINYSSQRHNHDCHHTKLEQLIPIPFSGMTTIREFVFNNTAREPRNMEPIYSLPFPVVYRIYFDDGHCHCGL